MTVAERYNSRSGIDGPNPSATLQYWSSGTTDKQLAVAAVRLVAPQYYTGADADGNAKSLVRQTFDAREAASGFWYVDVNYGPVDRALPSWQFDTSGGSTHITQALATVGAYGEGAAVTDNQGAIGVTDSGVEGCDVIIPKFTWSEQHIFEEALVTNGYVSNLAELTGTYNDSAWRIFSTGEVLFHGVQGSKSGLDDWNLTFNFEQSPNLTDYDVGGITVASKLGWHYQDVRYESEANDNIKAIVRKPKAVYIHRVYEPGDFSLLGIDYSF